MCAHVIFCICVNIHVIEMKLLDLSIYIIVIFMFIAELHPPHNPLKNLYQFILPSAMCKSI